MLKSVLNAGQKMAKIEFKYAYCERHDDLTNFEKGDAYFDIMLIYPDNIFFKACMVDDILLIM